MEFPLASFRLLYPMFDQFSDELVILIAEQAECFVSLYGCQCSNQLWMLMVAHMILLRKNAEAGTVTPGALTSASIDKISVSFSAPTSNTGWSHWLNLTPFGQQFLALSNRCNSGGRYVGAFPERPAFRNAGGRFPRRGRV